MKTGKQAAKEFDKMMDSIKSKFKPIAAKIRRDFIQRKYQEWLRLKRRK